MNPLTFFVEIKVLDRRLVLQIEPERTHFIWTLASIK